MRAMKTRTPDLEFVGIGGPLMAEEGLDSLLPMDDLCVMGLFEVLGQLPRLLALIKNVAGTVERVRPDVLVTIDLPDFNFEVVKRLRKGGLLDETKFVHYVAPSVWAWRSGRAKMLAGLYDQLLCVLPFEPDLFSVHGLEAHFIGHSLVEKGRTPDRNNFRAKHSFSNEDKVLGLFFGSRAGEFNALSETLIEAAKIIHESHTDVRFLAPTLPQHQNKLKALLADHGLDVRVVSDDKWASFSACDAAMAVSGTVGLELAYLGVPHITTYKAHPVTAFLVRRLIDIQYIHLANIIMDCAIVPEFIQEESTPENLSAAALALLYDTEAYMRQKKDLEALAKILGEEDECSPSQKAADIILN